MTATSASFLVLEDNEVDFMLLERALRSACTRISASIAVDITHVETLGEAVAAFQHRRFDCAFIDLIVSDSYGGLDSLARLRCEASTIPIVVLSGLNDAVLAVRALKDGAKDYLVKGRYSLSSLVQTILDAAPLLAGDKLLEEAAPTPELPVRIAALLSPRENDVLRQLLTGSSVTEIGAKLHLSPHTVRNHFRSIYSKLGVNSQTKLLLLIRAA
ncbi:MAG: response regulator transcription factor [Nannocystaceae bacterium]